MARYADNEFAKNEEEFWKKYRVNKELFEVIYKDLEPLMPQPTRRSDIPRKYKAQSELEVDRGSASIELLKGLEARAQLVQELMSRPTHQQLETIVDFLEQNPGIAKGLLRTAHAMQQTKRKWDEIAVS
ncbi:hypothetical protein PYW07_006594 [Mythimna separata]|uniref:Uncharacterized protein n=1 Tax=Mythimna separata TaxID=271217 RepID=A0AAD8DWW9_MYTSE|nr:hypothetical protein PYW07_006594 [Mythimna separata]